MARLLLEIDLPNETVVQAVSNALESLGVNFELAVMDPLTIAFQFPTFAERDLFILEKTIQPIKNVLEELNKLINEPSDINEHLRFLADLATDLDVVEFGCRNGVSTTALASTAKNLTTYDIDPKAIVLVKAKLCNSVHLADGTKNFRAVQGSTIDPHTYVPECDLLFIDSLHTYEQLSKELAMHGNKARMFLAFHDTLTFGTVSEDGTKPGLLAAIDEFMKISPHWKVLQNFQHNNGLMVLYR